MLFKKIFILTFLLFITSVTSPAQEIDILLPSLAEGTHQTIDLSEDRTKALIEVTLYERDSDKPELESIFQIYDLEFLVKLKTISIPKTRVFAINSSFDYMVLINDNKELLKYDIETSKIDFLINLERKFSGLHILDDDKIIVWDSKMVYSLNSNGEILDSYMKDSNILSVVKNGEYVTLYDPISQNVSFVDLKSKKQISSIELENVHSVENYSANGNYIVLRSIVENPNAGSTLNGIPRADHVKKTVLDIRKGEELFSITYNSANHKPSAFISGPTDPKMYLSPNGKFAVTKYILYSTQEGKAIVYIHNKFKYKRGLDYTDLVFISNDQLLKFDKKNNLSKYQISPFQEIQNQNKVRLANPFYAHRKPNGIDIAYINRNKESHENFQLKTISINNFFSPQLNSYKMELQNFNYLEGRGSGFIVRSLNENYELKERVSRWYASEQESNIIKDEHDVIATTMNGIAFLNDSKMFTENTHLNMHDYFSGKERSLPNYLRIVSESNILVSFDNGDITLMDRAKGNIKLKWKGAYRNSDAVYYPELLNPIEYDALNEEVYFTRSRKILPWWYDKRFENQFDIYKVSLKEDRDPIKISESMNLINLLYFDNNSLFATDVENRIHVYNRDKSYQKKELYGHDRRVKYLSYYNKYNELLSASDDGTVRLWDLNTHEEKIRLYNFENRGEFYLTKDNYFTGDKDFISTLYFKYKGELFNFAQFDLILNRPDKILEGLGFAETHPQIIDSYEKAYRKRLDKQGLNLNMISTLLKQGNLSSFSIPEINFSEGTPRFVNTSEPMHEISFNAWDPERKNLTKKLITINGVPIQ